MKEIDLETKNFKGNLFWDWTWSAKNLSYGTCKKLRRSFKDDEGFIVKYRFEGLRR